MGTAIASDVPWGEMGRKGSGECERRKRLQKGLAHLCDKMSVRAEVRSASSARGGPRKYLRLFFQLVEKREKPRTHHVQPPVNDASCGIEQWPPRQRYTTPEYPSPP